MTEDGSVRDNHVTQSPPRYSQFSWLFYTHTFVIYTYHTRVIYTYLSVLQANIQYTQCSSYSPYLTIHTTVNTHHGGVDDDDNGAM